MAEKKQTKKKPHYRSCNIRVSRVNNTQEGEIIYEYDDFKRVLTDWAAEKSLKYYAIKHDEDPNNVHYHAVIDFSAYTTFDVLKRKFPYGSIERPRNKKASIQYLIHMNNPEKKLYNWDDIFTNDSTIDRYRSLSREMLEMRVNELDKKIQSGELKRYNFYEVVESEVYRKKKSELETSLELYISKRLNDQQREVKVIVLEGASRTGKTVYARNFAFANDMQPLLSSSDNDPFQDYAGQEVFILDDLRDTTFSLENLIKILDPHHSTTTKSRYHNKLFIGDYIFITTNQPWNEWYQYDSRGNPIPFHLRLPLFSRVSFWYKFEAIPGELYKSKVSINKWSEEKKEYEFMQYTTFNYSHLIDIPDENKEDLTMLFFAQNS